MVLSSIAVIAGTFCKGGIGLASEFADSNFIYKFKLLSLFCVTFAEFVEIRLV
jgi:hypothetical protein